jgi:hypothetical protein
MTIIDSSPIHKHPDVKDRVHWMEEGKANVAWRVSILENAKAIEDAKDVDVPFIYISQSISRCLETFWAAEDPQVCTITFILLCFDLAALVECDLV